MKTALHILVSFAALVLSYGSLSAQVKIGDSIEVDKITHNFGDVLLGSGPVSCEYTITNIADDPCVIYNVVTSCGCTEAEWTRQPLKKGEQGKISVTYSNDEGPFPFDKSITVYLSSIKKPVILKLKGVSREQMRPVESLYPIHFGDLGLREYYIRCGNLEQGKSKTETVLVANISSSPLTVDFKDISEDFEISVTPNPIPPKATAEMNLTVHSDREKWGKNDYWATLLLNGKTVTDKGKIRKIGAWAFTKENFSHLTEDQKAKGPRPMFETSTYSFGKIKKGETVHAEFTFTNQGKQTFRIYKVDVDACCYSHSDIPAAAPGEKVTFRVHLDTKDMKAGESLSIITLTTNSPLRPIVNLFMAGWIEE